ncbi:MAG TPA: hypothetical protein VGM90_19070 [Kofleriaceae bacterium]
MTKAASYEAKVSSTDEDERAVESPPPTRKVTAWVQRWGDWIAPTAEPTLPGVWRRRDGGFRIRARTRDPKSGQRRGVNRALPDCKSARLAAATLETEMQAIRDGAASERTASMPHFALWAATVLERKIANGDIESASSPEKWDWALRVHLIPAFGYVYVDKLTREDIERWKTELLTPREKAKGNRNREIEGGRYKPATANTILAVLRQITAEASREFNIRDVAADIDNVNGRSHRTYGYETPNSVRPEDVPRFLELMRVKYPQHYAFVFLGITTGLRPSSLRPLRATGDLADVKWDDGKLLVRRSHTHGAKVMEQTKTGKDQVIALDPEQVSVLRWHRARLESENVKRAKRSPELAKAMAASDLLFPAEPNGRTRGGGYRAASCLDKAFADVGTAMSLGYEITPRAMRRTYQDLARAAKVSNIVTRAISGHATETMQHHYSSVADSEVRAGLAAVIDIATARKRAA